MVKPTPARIAEPWNAARHLREPESDQDPTRPCDSDPRANEQAEQDFQAYGIGERLCDSGVYDNTGIERCEQRQNHVGRDPMKVAFEAKPGRNHANDSL
jgi:hypothetical protein